jgi:ATP diphosphatase
VSDSGPAEPLSEGSSRPVLGAEGGPAGTFASATAALDRALVLVAYLRAHCAWDHKQTARSLIPHLLEEAFETVDAIQEGDIAGLQGELGDLLLNLAFQIVVAEENGHFTTEQVVRTLEDKMIRRHPHVFSGAERKGWESSKANERARERTARADGGEQAPPESVLAGLTERLDPLLRAHRVQEKVAGVGFDWDDVAGAVAKVREELAEVEAAIVDVGDRRDGSDASVAVLALEEELGDLLFSVVNVARLAGAHAHPALSRANRKFEERFRALEALAGERGVQMPGASLEEMDELWEEVKRRQNGD